MNSKKSLYIVYLGGFLLSMHYALVAYVNSSLIKNFVGNGVLNTLYIVGSLLSIASLYLAPFLLKKYGSVMILAIYITLEIIALFGMGSLDAGLIILFLFLIHHAGESMLGFGLDIQLEQEIKAEGTTGSKRGFLLTAGNIAWVISPLIVSFLVKNKDFTYVYELSAIMLVPALLLTIFYFKNIQKTDKDDANILKVFGALRRGGDSTRIIGSQFILQFFFSWMTIYLPLLLSIQIGFDWKTIGMLFTIMLLPFLIFELPAGIMSDKKWGEKEFLIVGFIIMFISTLAIPLIHSKIFLIWAITLFITRMGASLVEVASESYFFKHVKENDTALISLFRMVRPLSFILAPLIAIPVISSLSYSSSFIFLAVFTLLGLFCIPKVDTK